MMAAIRFRFLVTGILLAVPAADIFAQRASRAPGRRRAAPAPATAAAPETPKPTAKLRTEPPRQAADPAARAAVRGAVRNPAGEPASGATVWLVVREGEKFGTPITTSTGDNGQFSFPDVDDQTLSGDNAQSAVLVARDAEGRLGWRDFDRSRTRQVPNEISLTEVADITGRIVDADGRPVAGAKLKPRSVYVSRALAERVAAARNDRPDFFPDLAEQYQATTAADGSFKLSRIPRDAGIIFEVSVPGIDKLRVVLDSGRSATLRLRRPGSVVGRVTVPDGDPAGAEGLQLQIDLQTDAAKSDEAPLYYRDTATIDKTGVFRFEALPPGQYVISSVERQNVPLFAEPSPPVEVAAGEQLTEVTLPLKKAQSLHGSVIDARTGAGVEGVEVTISSWSDARTTDSRMLITDADGHFAAWLKPGQCDLRVSAVPEQYVTPPWKNTAPRDIPADGWPTISLTRAAQIEGVVVDELGNAVPGADIIVSGSRSFSRNEGPWQSDRSGKFKLQRIDPTENFIVRARTATKASDSDVPIDPSASAEPVTIVVSQNTACWASGQVVNEEGEPLPHAQATLLVTHFYSTSDRSFSTSASELLAAAADGTFESPALWPGDSFRIEVGCQGFGPVETVEVTGKPGMIHDFGPIVLRRTHDVQVEVVDEMGQSVPHAALCVMQPAVGRSRRLSTTSSLLTLEADDLGKQMVPLANPSATLSVWARSAAAVSDGAIVVWGPRLMRPVRIVVSEKSSCRLAGRVTDRGGLPVPEAKVTVVWDRRTADPTRRVRPVGRNGIVGLGARATDANGAFRSDALWPGERYHVLVSADGFEEFESPKVLVDAGETVDLGVLSPRRGDLAIAGRVLDSAGKPVAGATVVNSGDAREPLQTATDAEGRFRLEGLFEGPVYALVRKSGYRAAGMRGAAGADALEARLTHDGEAWQDVGPAQPLGQVPSADEQRLVARLLPELWKLHDRIDEDTQAGRRRTVFNSREPATKIRLIRSMAGIDLTQALSWSAADGGVFDDEARLAAAERIADDNVDEAIALLSGIDTTAAATTLRNIAKRRRLAGANDDAERLLRAAAGRATPSPFGRGRQPTPPEDAATKAQNGRAAVAAGDYETGSRLIEEAAEELEGLHEETSSGEPHATVITAVAAISPKRAIRLWEAHVASGKASNYFFQRTIDAAEAMAPHDMRETRRLLRLLDDTAPRAGTSRMIEQMRLKIAYQIAPRQPKVAIELVEEIGLSDVRAAADASGWIATAIAPRDQPLANQLIDRAFDLFATRGLAASRVLTIGADFGSPPVAGARLALHARASGYPDMRGAVDRALAMRITPGAGPAVRQRSPAELVESTVNTALLLALVDRDVARELLLSAAPYAHFIGQSGGETRPSAWLQAWALTDLARAEELFREALAKERSQSHPELIDSGLLPMLELLAEPPAGRVRFILSGDPYRQLYFWFPAE